MIQTFINQTLHKKYFQYYTNNESQKIKNFTISRKISVP